MKLEDIIDGILKEAQKGNKSLEVKEYLNKDTKAELKRRGYQVEDYKVKWK